MGRMRGLTQTGSGVSYKSVVLDWTADSQLRTVTRYSSPTTLVATSDYNHYDALARLTDVFHNGPAPRAYHWDFDAGDRITHSLAPADGDSYYVYDANDQLTLATYTYQATENFGYDRNGNRNINGSVPGGDNRLQSDSTYDYTYDNEGNRQTRTNRTTGEVVTYGWDFRNRPVPCFRGRYEPCTKRCPAPKACATRTPASHWRMGCENNVFCL